MAASVIRQERADAALVAAGNALWLIRPLGARLPSTIGVTVLVTHQCDETDTDSIEVVVATELDGDNLRDTLATALARNYTTGEDE